MKKNSFSDYFAHQAYPVKRLLEFILKAIKVLWL